jgi:hypothetical protein
MDTHPGPVRDGAIQVATEWLGLLETGVRDAQAEGAIDPAEDAEQLAFELDCYLLLANAQFVVSQEPTPIDRARRALHRRLAAAAARTTSSAGRAGHRATAPRTPRSARGYTACGVDAIPAGR